MEFIYWLNTSGIYRVLYVLQLLCIVHVIVTRRELWWVFLLLIPGISIVTVPLYLWREVWPTLRQRRVNFSPVLDTLKGPEGRIRARQEALEELNTPENRRALAQAYLQAGRLQEAEDTLAPLLTGIYRSDPLFQYEVAQVKLLNGKPQEARAVLEGLLQDCPHELKSKSRLLMALALQQLGDVEGARSHHLQALQTATGEEARYRYAEFLVLQQEKAEAQQQLEILLKTLRKASGTYRQQERQWETAARKLLQTLQQ